MKILKKILFVLLGIIGLVLLIALVAPKDFKIVREVQIAKPKQEVFDYIKYLKNQEEYSKWQTMDPGMKKTFEGVDGSPGFIAAWDSENPDVGIGEQEILKVTDGERIDMELRFKEPMEDTQLAYMTTEAISPNDTRVVWGFDMHMAYPMNVMALVMDFDKMIGDDLQTGLDNLKLKLESN
jgi:uncharacterized protein YndB with AHSA1/START domain